MYLWQTAPTSFTRLTLATTMTPDSKPNSKLSPAYQSQPTQLDRIENALYRLARQFSLLHDFKLAYDHWFVCFRRYWSPQGLGGAYFFGRGSCTT
jgi:hypothetical protein